MLDAPKTLFSGMLIQRFPYAKEVGRQDF